ncbi:hypothetical protein HPB47_008418 [Ixodes persulcatus]|uniref:Uncharacterized protein n=1 Tax=Ixodes persulcatus TaxID=34615 RepID=A0AC60P4V9_IXOPE|nr:hypothetical protein HPB47_008418 [Ixodes persulcatus]
MARTAEPRKKAADQEIRTEKDAIKGLPAPDLSMTNGEANRKLPAHCPGGTHEPPDNDAVRKTAHHADGSFSTPSKQVKRGKAAAGSGRPVVGTLPSSGKYLSVIGTRRTGTQSEDEALLPQARPGVFFDLGEPSDGKGDAVKAS